MKIAVFSLNIAINKCLCYNFNESKILENNPKRRKKQ